MTQEHKPKLSFSEAVVVREVCPSETATEIIREAAGDAWEDYLNYRYGSGYYVEFPAKINQLLSEGLVAEAKSLARECFAGHGLPDWLVK